MFASNFDFNKNTKIFTGKLNHFATILSNSDYNSPCECNKVITDILGKTEFSVDLENTGKNTQFKIKSKSEVKVILFL